MQAYKVKLVHRVSNTTVEFEAAPEISESGTVNYRSVDPVHGPGGITVYTNTASRTFNLGGVKLFCRTQAEATRNFNKLQIIKSWRYPTFGATLEDDALFGRQTLGTPPAVLELSAYCIPNGQSGSGANGLIHRVPVVITSLNITYPTDTDYIPTGEVEEAALRHIPAGIPVPIVQTIDIALLESHTPNQYASFSLTDLKRGKMIGF